MLKKYEAHVRDFLVRARTVPIADAQTREVWDRLLTAVETRRDCTPEFMMAMLDSLRNGSGRAGYNELSLHAAEDGSGRAVLSYGLFAEREIFCPTAALLDAYAKLLGTP
jgi:hypothetical protein